MIISKFLVFNYVSAIEHGMQLLKWFQYTCIKVNAFVLEHV